jgi:hypothetical protein
MFVNVDLVRKQLVGMFTPYVSASNGSLVTILRPKAKSRFPTVAIIWIKIVGRKVMYFSNVFTRRHFKTALSSVSLPPYKFGFLSRGPTHFLPHEAVYGFPKPCWARHRIENARARPRNRKSRGRRPNKSGILEKGLGVTKPQGLNWKSWLLLGVGGITCCWAQIVHPTKWPTPWVVKPLGGTPFSPKAWII